MNKENLSATDIFGIVAASVCAIHCIATPLIVPMLSPEMADFWKSPLAHQICAGAVGLFCVLAGIQGFKKHLDLLVLLPLACGLLLVLVGTFAVPENAHDTLEAPMLCAGSFVLIMGHIWNMRRISSCGKACSPTVDPEPVSAESQQL